jgi:sulfide:quinone oxidoreductase
MLDFTPSANDLGPDPKPCGARMDYLLQGADHTGAARAARPERSTRQLDAIVAGGGPAALEAALALTTLAPRAASVRVLAPEPAYSYRPLSVLEPFAAGHAREYPLERLAARGTTVLHDTLAEVDVAGRTLRTGDGAQLTYDALIVATGAGARRTLPDAITFGGSADAEAMHGLVQDIEGGWSERIAFVAPAGAAWTLPLYELALQTAERAYDLCLKRVAVTIVTHERQPLDVFGPGVAAPVAALLREAGVAVVTGAQPSVPRTGCVDVGPGSPAIEVDRVVALPVPTGRPVPGLPSDDDGFLPVDRFGRLSDAAGVYAAGDGTSHPLKQGGLATQQADVAVATLLADAGLASMAEPYCPVLRGMLIAGTGTLYLRRAGTDERGGEASQRALWWPPTKIAGRYLAPFLDELDADLSAAGLERRRAMRNGAVRRRAILARAGDAEDTLIALVEHAR